MTLNPAIDKTIVVPHLTVGAIHRTHETHLDPAGKGINAARMVGRLGWPVLALGFLAGDIGHLVQRALAEESVPFAFTWTGGQTCINVNLFDASAHEGTSFYEDGPAITAAARADFLADLRSRLPGASVLILAGSLPPCMPPTIYAEIIADAHRSGVPVFLDADGEALRQGLAGRPALVKPNRVEASAILGRPLADHAAVASGAKELVARGAGIAVISLGGDGAIAANSDGAWLAIPPAVELRSTVGSGDSMLAGLAIAAARGEPIERGLCLGTAAGAATAMVAGTRLGQAEDVDTLLPLVHVRRVG